jgi:hypothetical protein
MALFLRKQHAQDAIEGRSLGPWSEEDYSVVDGFKVGRIYRDARPGGVRWCWFLHVHGATPNTGAENTLEEAKKALREAYERAGGIEQG